MQLTPYLILFSQQSDEAVTRKFQNVLYDWYVTTDRSVCLLVSLVPCHGTSRVTPRDPHEILFLTAKAVTTALLFSRKFENMLYHRTFDSGGYRNF